MVDLHALIPILQYYPIPIQTQDEISRLELRGLTQLIKMVGLRLTYIFIFQYGLNTTREHKMSSLLEWMRCGGQKNKNDRIRKQMRET
jgi:hypothetical protein